MKKSCMLLSFHLAMLWIFKYHSTMKLVNGDIKLCDLFMPSIIHCKIIDHHHVYFSFVCTLESHVDCL